MAKAAIRTTKKGNVNLRGTPPDRAPNQIAYASHPEPLTDELLKKYRDLANGIDDPRLKDVFEMMLGCVEMWWNLPESKEKPIPTPTLERDPTTGRSVIKNILLIVPLSDDLVDKLWDHTPWRDEIQVLSNPKATGILDTLPPGDLQKAAFHLLWHCAELSLDREPTTKDKLPKSN